MAYGPQYVYVITIEKLKLLKFGIVDAGTACQAGLHVFEVKVAYDAYIKQQAIYIDILQQ